MRVSRILTVLLALHFGGSLSGQNQLRIVDQTVGPHLDIQSAINAANSGDVILVAATLPSTTYPSFDMSTSKSIGITADAGALVIVQPSRIRNLSAIDQVVIRGIRFTHSPAALPPFNSFELLDNDGDVWFEDCDFVPLIVGAPPSLPAGLPAINATTTNASTGAGLITFINCKIRGHNGYYSSGAYTEAGNGLSVGAAYDVAIWDTIMEGGFGAAGIPTSNHGKDGGVGFTFAGNDLCITNGDIRGGRGGNGVAGSACGDGGAGGDGMHMNGSGIQADAIGSTIFGGHPGNPSGGVCVRKPWGQHIAGISPGSLSIHDVITRQLISLNSPIRLQAPTGTGKIAMKICGVNQDGVQGWRDVPHTYNFRNIAPVSPNLGELGLIQATASQVAELDLWIGATIGTCMNKDVNIDYVSELGADKARMALFYLIANKPPEQHIHYSTPTYVFFIDATAAP